MKIKYFLILLILFCTNVTILAGVGDWTTFISQTDVRDLILFNDHIWCATNGGVFSYQIATGNYQQYNNTNGLTSLDARTIEVDKQGNIWIGFGDGWINRFNPAADEWNIIQDYVGRKIYDLEAIGDSMLIALDIGISLYDVQRREVKETYKRLGWQLTGEIAVLDILLVDREIWAATGSGIARSSFDLANLMAPESWINYSTLQGLPSNTINTLEFHNGTIYAGTESGVAVLQGQNWSAINSNLPDLEIMKLISKNNELYAVTVGYVSRWIAEENLWRNVAPFLRPLTSLAIAENGDLWVGRQKSGEGKGFARFSIADQTWEILLPPGPPGNIINGLAIDHDEVLWCASSYDGIFRFDGQAWRQYTTADGLINNAVEMVMVDSQNRKWFGGIGSGLVMIDANDTITVFHNEILSGINEDPNWVVVSDIKEDQYNNVWILNSFAANNNVVAVYTPQKQWYFFSVQEGILSKVLTSLDFDRADRVWVGTQSGVSVIDYNNTLANKTDDVIAGNNLTTADGLENNNIKDVVIDQDEIVWIATEAGVNYWNPSAPQKVSYQYGLLSNSVNSVEIDIRNNKWFGTSAGVSILGSDGYTWTHYSTDNSPLVNDNVTSFGFDFETGKVYIGTSNGLSVLETPYSRPREDLNQVKAGPNPFLAGPGNEFTFLDLADDVSIKIMTENGMIVRKIDNENILGAVTSWDGKNSNDEYVASGIYLYVIYNEDTGQNRVGKIAVIRE
ncbi:MAG: hypothetical protein MUC94_09150 [bacterium]|jgi:ligand-binding sensor domain-containing protein|nr:hypothetical protein [bacterium]